MAIVWDAPKEAFFIPFSSTPIYWYSIFFACGFYASLLLAKHLLQTLSQQRGGGNRKEISSYLEKLSTYLFCGIVIGARLGHVLFYDLEYYSDHPIEILNLRQGGLSSHGGIIGMLIALWIWNKKNQFPAYLPHGKDLLDLIAISSIPAAICIRIGNFINQEVIGTPTQLPWGVIFMHPTDGLGGVMRHPSQLYEAISAAILLGVFLYLGRDGKWASSGKFAGWFLVSLFTFRFFIEMTKAPQSSFDGIITVGQILSIPVILLGVYLIWSSSVRRDQGNKPHSPS